MDLDCEADLQEALMLASGLNEADYETFLAEEADMRTEAPEKEPAKPSDIDEILKLVEQTPRVNLKALRLKLKKRAKRMAGTSGKPRKKNKTTAGVTKASFKRIRRWVGKAKTGRSTDGVKRHAGEPIASQRTSSSSGGIARAVRAIPAPSIDPSPDPKDMKLPSNVDRDKLLAAIAHYEV